MCETLGRVCWVPKVGHAEGGLETRPPPAVLDRWTRWTRVSHYPLCAMRARARVRARVRVGVEYETGVHGVHLSTKWPPCLKNEARTSVSQTVDGYSAAKVRGRKMPGICPASRSSSAASRKDCASICARSRST